MSSDANINTRMSLMSTLTANDLRDNHPIQSPRFQTKRCGNPLIPNKIRSFDSQRVDKFPFSFSQFHFGRGISLVSHRGLRPVEATVQEKPKTVGA